MTSGFAVHFTLLDQLEMAGPYGKTIVLAALILSILGVIFIFTRPSLAIRRAHLLACFLPCGLGVLGFVSGWMSAFATLGRAGVGDAAAFFSALGEISLAPCFGFIASGIALLFSGLVWLRAEKPAA
jgi:hypothetical protein